MQYRAIALQLNDEIISIALDPKRVVKGSPKTALETVYFAILTSENHLEELYKHGTTNNTVEDPLHK